MRVNLFLLPLGARRVPAGSDIVCTWDSRVAQICWNEQFIETATLVLLCLQKNKASICVQICRNDLKCAFIWPLKWYFKSVKASKMVNMLKHMT